MGESHILSSENCFLLVSFCLRLFFYCSIITAIFFTGYKRLICYYTISRFKISFLFNLFPQYINFFCIVISGLYSFNIYFGTFLIDNFIIKRQIIFFPKKELNISVLFFSCFSRRNTILFMESF